MDQKKVEKIQQILLQNPELHTQFIGLVRSMLKKMGEVFTADELFSALKLGLDEKVAGDGSTHEEFWAHYR